MLTLTRKRMDLGAMAGIVGLHLHGHGSLEDHDIDGDVSASLARYPGVGWITLSGFAMMADVAESVIAAAGVLHVIGRAKLEHLGSPQLCTWLQAMVSASWAGADAKTMAGHLDPSGGLASPDEIIVELDTSAAVTPRWLDDLWSVLSWDGPALGTLVIAEVDLRLIEAAATAKTPWRIQERR